jgi:hypothetical protein
MLDWLDVQIRAGRKWRTHVQGKPFEASISGTLVVVDPLLGRSKLTVDIEWEDLERELYAALPALQEGRTPNSADLAESRHKSYSVAFAIAAWAGIKGQRVSDGA